MSLLEKLQRAEAQYARRQNLAIQNHLNLDANETFFLERELTQLRAKAHEVQYPALLARTFAPKATDIAATASTYSYKVTKHIGKADHRGYQAKDHPRADVNAVEVTGVVRPLTAVYGWDINELAEAARLGLPLSQAKANAARDIIERGIDETLAYGSVLAADTPRANGCMGLVNNTDVEGAGNAAVLTGGYWTTALSTATMLANLHALAVTVGQVTKQAFEADSIILPKTHYDLAAGTPWNTVTGESVLAIFLKNHPNIKSVSPWHLLDSVTAAQGGETKPRGIAYKKDAMILEAVIPLEFEALPPQADNFTFDIPCHARCGAIKWYQPLGGVYMDFATS